MRFLILTIGKKTKPVFSLEKSIPIPRVDSHYSQKSVQKKPFPPRKQKKRKQKTPTASKIWKRRKKKREKVKKRDRGRRREKKGQ